MRTHLRDFFVKPLLALAVAMPVAGAFSVSEADAGNRRAAIIAGAISGGAIAYHHYKRKRHHRSYYRSGYYGYPRYYGVRTYRRGHRHRHHHRHGYNFHRQLYYNDVGSRSR